MRAADARHALTLFENDAVTGIRGLESFTDVSEILLALADGFEARGSSAVGIAEDAVAELAAVRKGTIRSTVASPAAGALAPPAGCAASDMMSSFVGGRRSCSNGQR